MDETTARLAHVAEPKARELAEAKGFTYWAGGQSAPDDWDGGPYLCRDGQEYHMAGYDWGHGTHCWNETADWDRIGYRRKALEQTQNGKT
jgi:hypothetical protein